MGDVLLAISLQCHALRWAQVPGMQRMQDRDTAGFGWPPFYAHRRPCFLVPLEKSKRKAASSPPHAVLQPLLVLSLVNIIQAGNVIPAWPPDQIRSLQCNGCMFASLTSQLSKKRRGRELVKQKSYQSLWSLPMLTCASLLPRLCCHLTLK
jgi:hypothetical protein